MRALFQRFIFLLLLSLLYFVADDIIVTNGGRWQS